MLKKRIVILTVAVSLLMGGCAAMNESNIEDKNISPEIVRIEGHLYSANGEDVVIDQSDKISEILNVIDNLTEIGTYDASSLTEEISLDFYKPSVAIIKSEDRRVYSLIFYENSNIVKMQADLGIDDNITSALFGDALGYYYEISDQDKEYIEKIFE